MNHLTVKQLQTLLHGASRARLLVVGDVMLDQFLWGNVTRISPEAPVPVVEFERESFRPGGAANVARNLAALGARVSLVGLTGSDPAARQLRELLAAQQVDCRGLVGDDDRMTTRKVRVIAQQQQVVRVDRETRGAVQPRWTRRLLDAVRAELGNLDAIIVGDYGKGVVTQPLLDELKGLCRSRGIWLSLDPKPVHQLALDGLSLITPNRKEAFDLAGREDPGKAEAPLTDTPLLDVAGRLLETLRPALLLITLGDRGMLLCQRNRRPFHIPTLAQEVYDVSGAGDTVIATFTLAIVAGASPVQAAIFSNHAAGIVVGKVGTAVVTPAELRASFRRVPKT
jgi:D-beta-D-heptose 7-phosphate kinase/D-beta-D-heptose 1-phosphate adenosyltransferase